MRSLDDELTEEESEQFDRWRERRDPNFGVSPSVRALSEFGHFYGWNGVAAALKNEMTYDLFRQLLEQGRRDERLRSARFMSDVRNAVVTAMNKHGDTEMKQLTEQRIREGEDDG